MLTPDGIISFLPFFGGDSLPDVGGTDLIWVRMLDANCTSHVATHELVVEVFEALWLRGVCEHLFLLAASVARGGV